MRKALYLLGHLNDSDVEWLIARGRKERLPAGTVLIREGQPIAALHILLDGALDVVGAVLGTDRPVRLGCGEVVGEISFVDSRPPTATVTAARDSVVLSIPRPVLRAKLEQDLGFAARFYRALAVFLADRLRGTGRRLGYGREQPLDDGTEYEGELGPDVLDNVHLAGARFERVLRRLLATGAPAARGPEESREPREPREP